jgi:gamma-glutamylcyclotransferase (GGCT)/AIG2-like uncharacterized protein YtfP
MSTKIFVYGTLRKNFSNHSFLQTARFLGNAKTAKNYVMFTSGYIPFVSDTQSVCPIIGEVYEVDQVTLQNLDRLEYGYTRKTISVLLAGEIDSAVPEDAWMYFNNDQTHHAIISTGDFADNHRFYSKKKSIWYFAYGSNMNPQRMIERNAFFTKRIKGWIADFRLVFNKTTGSPGFGYANIISEKNQMVEGILYEIDDRGLAELDIREGVETMHYKKVFMSVQHFGDGDSIDAVVYIAHPEKIENGLKPTKKYASHLYQGLDVLGRESKEYLDRAIKESVIFDHPKFVSEYDIPNLQPEHFEGNFLSHALSVFIDGIPAKIYQYDSLWSPRIVINVAQDDLKRASKKLDLNFDEEGFCGTKYFDIPRPGILQIGYRRFVVEREGSEV